AVSRSPLGRIEEQQIGRYDFSSGPGRVPDQFASEITMAFPQDRPRRLRATEGLRSMVREPRLCADNLIAPFLVCEGRDIRHPISSMATQYRFSVDHMVQLVELVQRLVVLA